MKRNVFGGFAIAGGLALWATVGAAAQGTTTAATFDPSTCPAADQLSLQPSLTGINSPEATAQLTELNADATLGKAEIVADTNAALAELSSGNDDEANSEDGLSTLTIDAKIMTIKAAGCQALGALVAEYNQAVAELKAEFTQPEPTVQPEPENHKKADVDKDNERQDTERDQPEQSQTTISSTSREGND
ncbi:MAG TPA: hypothetical protein VFR68_03560 [Candidatus Dormibacteraeota bacterium]|nr:hypothetical protein [Candidatus Dormibacteraeota bacterium]